MSHLKTLIDKISGPASGQFAFFGQIIYNFLSDLFPE